jgi:hypothetical protein
MSEVVTIHVLSLEKLAKLDIPLRPGFQPDTPLRLRFQLDILLRLELAETF